MLCRGLEWLMSIVVLMQRMVLDESLFCRHCGCWWTKKKSQCLFAIDCMLNNRNIGRSWLHGAHEHILPKDVSVKDKDVIVQGEHLYVTCKQGLIGNYSCKQ